jgi:ElaB/YqjD/DUF883 family membrane-anchored ribosome-binding protein
MTYQNEPPFSGVDPVSGRYPAGAPQHSAGQPQPSSTEVAKDQAGQVANTARDAGKHVAGVAGEQVGQVASEANQQIKQLVTQTRGELTDQAAVQQKRVASGLRSLSKELSSMADGSEQSGMATELVHQVGARTNAVASWLEDREPGHVVDEVTRFARQRPGAFLAIAAGAGLLVGRLGRGLKAANDNSSQNAPQRLEAAPAIPEADLGYQRYSDVPPPPAPTYPPTGYDPSGYEPAPGYRQQAPGYPQPQAPAYPPRTPGYPPQQAGYPPQAPGGSSGWDVRP